ncbi:MAG: hypothetical protein ACYCVH_05140 [Ignavibacteriaceae bacterium]
MKELINLETGTQYLLENQKSEGQYESIHFGADFSKFDVSGFDDCFPTIDSCVINSLKNKYSKYNFPDHGELWSRAWKYSTSENSITFEIKGVNFNYVFFKQFQLEGNRVLVTYKVKNLSSDPLPYIWSAHPLLNVKEGDKIIIPEEIELVYLNWVSDPTIGSHGDFVSWPFLSKVEKKIDYSWVRGKNHNLALKCYTEKIANGYAGVYFPEKEESIFFSFDTKKIPFLGIWICYGGWPEDSDNKHFTIGLEPTNGRPDSLAEAIENRECSIVEEYSEKKWELEISIWQGTPNIKLFKGKKLIKNENLINQ